MNKEGLTEVLNHNINDAYQSALVDFKEEYDRDNLTDEFCTDFISYFNNSKINGEPLDVPMVRMIFGAIMMDSNRIYSDFNDSSIDDVNILNSFIKGEHPYDHVVKAAYYNLRNNQYDDDLLEKVKDKINGSIKTTTDDMYDSRLDIEKLLDNYIKLGVVITNVDDNGNKVWKLNPDALRSNLGEMTRFVKRLTTIIDSMNGNDDTKGLVLLSNLTQGFGEYAKSLAENPDITDEENEFINAYKTMLSHRKKKRDSIIKYVINDESSADRDNYIRLMLPLLDTTIVSIDRGRYRYADDASVYQLLSENDDVRNDFCKTIKSLYSNMLNDITLCSPDEYRINGNIVYNENTDTVMKGMVRYILFLNDDATRKYVSEFVDGNAVALIDDLFKMFMLSYSMFKVFNNRKMEYSDKEYTLIINNIDAMIRQLGLKNMQSGYVFNPDMLFTSKRPVTEFDKYVAKNVVLYDIVSDFTINYNKVSIDMENSETHSDDMELLEDTISQMNEKYENIATISLSPLLSDSTIKFDKSLLQPHVLPDFYSDICQVLNYYTEKNDSVVALIRQMMSEVSNSVLDSGWDKPVKIFSKLIARPKENLNSILSYGLKNDIVNEDNGKYTINTSNDISVQLKYIKELEKYCVYSNMVVFGKTYYTKAPRYMYEYYDVVREILGPYIDNPVNIDTVPGLDKIIKNILAVMRK